MDPFARKMIYGSFVYGGMMLAMFAVLTVFYLHTRPRCSDRVVAESTSPSTQWTAIMMERRCGSDAPFYSHVNLRPAGNDLKRGFFSGSATEGEVFMIEEDIAEAGVMLHWTSPAKLRIQCPRCKAALVRQHDERWGNVVIEYLPPPR
ncbi:MAG TPA: hypothetical protein VGP89_00780 [Candidatus Angelobacter sp.]|jgi:hypothetical protein|nr:hypothetical protein [Candidatus Angelobacter sp.]